uniref:Protein MIS12 homolog n=1 Tax=Elaeophora elaphi TaxID=1147741 RepID=A0A0R3S410_9BILA
MAESLEGSRDMDCDKKMDSLGYSREQFDKFIHDYRELAEPSSYNSHESNTSIDAALKKDFINVERKLTKIFYAVRKLPKTEALNGLCLRVESMLDIFKMLKIVKEDNEEFSLDNVPLPDYDAADMELLLGKEFSSTKVIRKNGLSKFKNKLREQIIENIRIAKILLEECDETVSLHQEKGDCIVWSFIESKNQKSEIKWMVDHWPERQLRERI